MSNDTRKLLTIVTEASLEREIIRTIELLGVAGYTFTNARGGGRRGRRGAAWEHDTNIRVEIVCERALALQVTKQLRATFFDDYAMVIWLQDVEVLRTDQFV
jgi:hypothetical protein